MSEKTREEVKQDVLDDFIDVYGVEKEIVDAVLRIYFNRYFDKHGDSMHLDTALLECCNTAYFFKYEKEGTY